MGFNPILLVNPYPTSENIIVHVVRPGEDINVALEDARNQIAANSTRRRKRGRGASRNVNKIEIDSQSSTNPVIDNQSLINDDSLILSSEDQSIINEANLEEVKAKDETELIEVSTSLDEQSDNQSDSEIEDPRRKRRRSSASK